MSGTNGNGKKPRVIKPRDYRHDCGRLLFRAILVPGCVIEIRCPRCGRMAVIPPPIMSVTESAIVELTSETVVRRKATANRD